MNKRIEYIEVLRCIATLAVVFLHINMTLPANYSKDELGYGIYTLFNCFYMVVSWAVPVFFMISGALLLSPHKRINIHKIIRYIFRIFFILFLFGTIFAIMELVFSERKIEFWMLFKSIVNVLEGKSWDHLWYLYVLIGLYILTIPLKYVINNIGDKELEILLFILFTGNFILPTINGYFEKTFQTYMLVDNSVVYFLLGYYLSVTKRNLKLISIFCLPTSLLILIVTEIYGVYTIESLSVTNMMGNNCFRALAAISLFCIAKTVIENRNNNFIHNSVVSGSCWLSQYSFGVYLIHPFFINLIFKVVGITPMSGPTIIMIFILFFIVCTLSILATFIMKKIPIIHKYL